MSIGDVHSSARGSGARYNDGKPAMELIPCRVIAATWNAKLYYDRLLDDVYPEIECLQRLAAFQEGETEDCLVDAMLAIGCDWELCARVFEYGRKKYAEWNWAKGMPWSVPIGCIVRHLMAIVERGELTDPESGLHHHGHIMCNLVMLHTFVQNYPEGDDRPILLSASGGLINLPVKMPNFVDEQPVNVSNNPSLDDYVL